MKVYYKLSLILFLFFSFLSGCTPLFYHPSQKALVNLQKLKIEQPEEVHFFSRDKTPLHGWYFRNKIKTRAKGLLVFFHGNAENITTHFANLYWILEHGYDYFIFDYQGYGESKGKPSPRRTLDDGVGAVCWAYLRNPKLPLILFGQSLGGTVALQTIIEVKNDIPITYIIVDSTFHSYKSVARSVMAQSILTWPFQPLGYLLVSDQYAPKRAISEISPIPILILHGDKDKIVAFHLGKMVYQLAQEPKEFIKIPEGGHIDAFQRHHGKYRKELILRLDKVMRNPLPHPQNYNISICDSFNHQPS